MSDLSLLDGSRALDFFLRKTIVKGSLTVTVDDGEPRNYGDGEGPSVSIHIRDTNLWNLVRDPEMQIPEAYMDQRLEITEGTLDDFFDIKSVNDAVIYASPNLSLFNIGLWGAHKFNSIAASISNVAHHYDASNEFYKLWAGNLDHFLYSCAYWTEDGDTLETAQQRKLDHIARKLDLKPGMEVLDIGCGWGATALELASKYGVKVTAVTLSAEQYANCQAIAASRPDLALNFQFKDYRQLQAEVVAGEVPRFDRIVSIGMFEHVGRKSFDEYMAAVRDFLKPDGSMLLHTIGLPGKQDATGGVTRWMDKYIFPGSYIPAKSELAGAAEKAGLVIGDYESWVGRHYANTLKAWSDRFEANIDKIRGHLEETKTPKQAESEIRMWRLYLKGVEKAFRKGYYEVHHAQIFRDPTQVPDSRDYMYYPSKRPRHGEMAAVRQLAQAAAA